MIKLILQFFYMLSCLELLILPLILWIVPRPGWLSLAIFVNLGFWGYQLMSMSGYTLLSVF